MRFDRDSFREIADSLTRNKSRSLLTGFGIFWGLFMLLFMLGGGQGVKQLLASNFEGFANNTSVLYSNRTTKPWHGMKEGRGWSLDDRDVERLKLMVPELDIVTGMVSQWGMKVQRDGKDYDGMYTASVKGVLPEYASIETPSLRYGRFLNQVDIDQNRKVCVIGKDIYESLYEEDEDPCGTFIQVGSVYYEVVGVDVHEGNISINGSARSTIVIPMPLAKILFNKGSSLDMLSLTGKGGINLETLDERVRSIIAREHNIDPSDKDAIGFLHLEQLFRLIDNIFKGVNFIVWLIGLGTLLAGAIGVGNIMMVTVRERTIEIGIRRAIGATPRDVLSQILWESIILTLLAGMLAIVFTVGILAVMDIVAAGKASFQISFGTAVGAAILLTVLGIAAGIAPALRAMQIKPVDAMRDE